MVNQSSNNTVLIRSEENKSIISNDRPLTAKIDPLFPKKEIES